MSIEDVDYLLEHSEDNSITIFIDSKNRDTNAYPAPSSYVVDFSDHPIRNVYGIEILDATIPATAYTVDANTNTVAFSQVFYAAGTGIYDVANPTTFAAHIDVLQNVPAFDAIFSAKTNASMFCCSDPALYDQIQFTDPGVVTPNAAFYVQRIPIVANGAGASTMTLSDGSTVSIDTPPAGGTGASTGQANKPANTFSYNFQDAFVVHVEWKYTLLDSEINAVLGLFSTAPQFDIFICNTTLNLPIGSYTSDFLMTTMTGLFKTAQNQAVRALEPQIGVSAVTIVPAFTDNPIQGQASITQVISYTNGSTKYPFILDMKKSTANYSIGFSQLANAAAGTTAYSALSHSMLDIAPLEFTTFGYTTFSYLDNRKIFMSTPQSSGGFHSITTPGVVNLESARYILLRCPEIESHMLGSYANFKYAPGIGLFKLTSSNSLMNLRFDFVNIVRKPFHPIGKLGKLTLAFENPDTSLYDFKGVDHVLMISIKYYAPKNITRVPKSVLNPQYLPNILEYQLKQYKDGSLARRLREKYSLEEVVQEQKKYF